MVFRELLLLSTLYLAVASATYKNVYGEDLQLCSSDGMAMTG